jgi:hypothetical protein
MQRNLSGCPILSLSVRASRLIRTTRTRLRQRKLATSQQLCALGFATKNDLKFMAVVTLSASLGINCIHVRRSVYANPKMPDL